MYSEDTYTYHDNPSVLDASHDAATANWGSNWRMPTEEEFQELIDNCDWERISDYNGTGVSGRIIKSRSNTNSIFLPAAGYRYGSDLNYAGSDGYYWSSTVYDSDNAWELYFYVGDRYLDYYRYYGRSVRPVRCKN